jgi:2-phosphoglycerate kinase
MYVVNDGKRYPFSKGILAKSLYQTGVPLEEAYDIVRDILDSIPDEAGEITSKDLKKHASEELIERGWKEEERYYRLRDALAELNSPVFILLGGGSGVGKTTLATEVGRRLGIDRIVGTDTVREIMRGILSPELVPTLHESTYNAMDRLKTPYITDKLIYAFSQQVSLVNKGIGSVIDRGIKEGLDMIVDGVHIVPGYLESVLSEIPDYMFQYVIDVPDPETHRRHFYSREKDSLRDPERYLDNFDRINRIHEYILDVARKRNVKVLENSDLTLAIDTIISDTITRIEQNEETVGVNLEK